MHALPALRRALAGGVLSLLAAVSSLAQPAPNARIDLVLRDDVRLAVIEISAGGEARESAWNDTRSLVCTFPASTAWQTAAVTLRASRDGRVLLLPMSERQSAATPSFILYDTIEASDGSVKNGEFKHLDDTGVPLWWTLSSFAKTEGATASVLPPATRDGGRAIRVWHGTR